MPTINKLPLLDTISGGDQLPVYSPNAGDARRMSINSLADYMQDNLNFAADIDSSDVDFIQAGTGAVQRTAQSKMRDVVSVKDFGAVGDGVADDTAAIQAALNSGTACVSFSGGTYLITAGITIPSSVKQIVSVGGTIKRGNINAFYLLLLPSSGIFVDGLTVDGNSPAFPGALATAYIDILTTNGPATVSNVLFKNSPGTGVGGQANGVRIVGCGFEEWKDHAIYFSGTTSSSNAANISIVGNYFKHGAGADNGCVKFRNNVANVVVDSNTFSLQSSVPFIQDDQGGVPGLGDGLTYFNKRITISNNSGECVYFYGKTTNTPVTDVSSAKSITTIEGNSVFCSFFAYLGTPSLVSIGDLNILNNTVEGVLLWFRNIDNTNYANAVNIQENTVFGNLILCENTMPSLLTVKSNNLFISTFFITHSVADADTTSRIIDVRDNYIVKSGSALSRLITHASIQQNTAVYVVGNYIKNVSFVSDSMGNGPLTFVIENNVSSGGAVTTSNSQEFTLAAGNLVISNNTFGGRLMLENANAKSSCMLTRYNAFIFGNRTDNVAEVVYTFGSPVTSYSGANKFYSEGNFGVGSTVANGYPAGAKAALPAISL